MFRWTLTWHVAVRARRHVSGGAGALLGRHAASHRVQHQDDGIYQSRVGIGQSGETVKLRVSFAVTQSAPRDSNATLLYVLNKTNLKLYYYYSYYLNMYLLLLIIIIVIIIIITLLILLLLKKY